MSDNLDLYDKQILKILINNKDQELTTREIAKKAKINWLTAERHLEKLKKLGLVEEEKVVKYQYKKNGKKSKSKKN